MKSISLAVYGVRLKVARSSDAEEEGRPLSTFTAAEDDFGEVATGLLEELRADAYVKEDSQQVLQVSQVERANRLIEGLVQVGQYGSESEIRNLDEWDVVAYQKAIRDADLEPYYFLFDIPEQRDLGLLLLQRTGVSGVHGILARALQEKFRARFPDHRLVLKAIVPETLIEQMRDENNALTEVRFIRHQVPTDIAAILGAAGTEQGEGSMELVVRTREAGRLRAIQRYFEANPGMGGMLEIDETRFQYDSVKVKVKMDGKERTMDLSNPTQLRAAFDITPLVEWSAAGHPTFASVSQAARDLLTDLSRQLYGRVGGV